MTKESEVPQPGPARLSKGAGPDEWLEQAKLCKYLPEADMKRLCEIVKEFLMEGVHRLSSAVLPKNRSCVRGMAYQRQTDRSYNI
jgi:hypothetical protein